MNNQPIWFNESNYEKFLTESSILWEMNIPYQKQKFENRKKLANFDRETAIRKGRLKAELARDLYQAKAKGLNLKESMFSKKINEINNIFLNTLLAEAETKRNSLKTEKRKMRPEVDPKDRDRDRKREERKQQAQSGLSAIIIVKNNKLNKIEIITKDDYNPEQHTLLKGKVKKLDKGNVSKRDLIYYSKLNNFMNTKTSIRLLGGRIEQAKEKQENNKSKTKENTQIQPPPIPRAPKDGKEITDPDSSYPDWDHSTDQFISSTSDALNSLSGKKLSPEIQELLTGSRTLGDAIQRFTKEIFAAFPAAGSMTFKKPKPIMKTGKMWNSMGLKEGAPNCTLIATGDNQKLGVVLKIGEQIRPINKGEAGLVFNSIFANINPQRTATKFNYFIKDFIEGLRKNYTAISIPMPITDKTEGTAALFRETEKAEKIKTAQKILINKAAGLFEKYVNEDYELKSAILLEALTGNMKFEGKDGSAQMMFTCKKDGTDVKAIPLTPEFSTVLAKSSDTNLSIKFAQSPNSSNGFLQNLFSKITALNESSLSIIGDLETIKDQLSNPQVFLQLFELQISDAVFTEPILYSDFYTNESDVTNTIVFNPGTRSEEEIQIPVHKNYTPDGDEQNVVEKGADALLEEYLNLNDILVENIKTQQIELIDALIILEEGFRLQEKRNYRKEYDNYHSKPKQRANRSKRVLARRKMEEKGRVSKGDGKDVDHKNGNPQDNSDDNLRVLSKSKNRSMNEDHGAGFEGTPEYINRLLKDTPFSNQPYVGKKSLSYLESQLDKKLKPKKK